MSEISTSSHRKLRVMLIAVLCLLAAASTVQAATLKKQNIKVNKTSYKLTMSSDPFLLNAKAAGGASLTYKSSNKKVATVTKSGIVSVKGQGKAVITIRSAKTKKYAAASKKVAIYVYPKKLKYTLTGSGKELKMEWKPDWNCDGYLLQYSDRSDFKGKNTTTLDFTNDYISETFKDYSGKWYFRIKAYKKIGGKKYGTWSKVGSFDFGK